MFATCTELDREPGEEHRVEDRAGGEEIAGDAEETVGHRGGSVEAADGVAEKGGAGEEGLDERLHGPGAAELPLECGVKANRSAGVARKVAANGEGSAAATAEGAEDALAGEGVAEAGRITDEEDTGWRTTAGHGHGAGGEQGAQEVSRVDAAGEAGEGFQGRTKEREAASGHAAGVGGGDDERDVGRVRTETGQRSDAAVAWAGDVHLAHVGEALDTGMRDEGESARRREGPAEPEALDDGGVQAVGGHDGAGQERATGADGLEEPSAALGAEAGDATTLDDAGAGEAGGGGQEGVEPVTGEGRAGDRVVTGKGSGACRDAKAAEGPREEWVNAGHTETAELGEGAGAEEFGADLVTREPGAVEDEDVDASAGEADRSGGTGGTSAHDDDVRGGHRGGVAFTGRRGRVRSG